jgi:hypothetical protein
MAHTRAITRAILGLMWLKFLSVDLVESLKQAKAISKDDAKASRRFKVGTIKGAKVDISEVKEL